jgi:hypothetical protein
MAKLNARQRIINAATDNFFAVRNNGSLLNLRRGDVSVTVNFVANGTRIALAEVFRGDHIDRTAFVTQGGSQTSVASHDVANQVVKFLNEAPV